MKFIVLFLICFYSRYVASLDTEWWKHTIIYEIIPSSFKDSDGDGIGDIKGIISKLDHFVDLKIETLHFTPIHKTSGRDMGYDVIDFYSINPVLGTMDDFNELIKEMKKRNMKLLLDFVLNHSSNESEWFQKSIDRIDPYTDYYIWKDSIGYDNENEEEIAPNDWTSIFGGSAWTWNDKRKQFYFHQFLEEQVDFNLRNQDVVEEIKNIIKFWLDKGVAGFRLDAVSFLFENEDLSDNEWSARADHEDSYAFLHELRLFMDDYNKKQGKFERMFVAEAHTSDEHLLKLYGTEAYPVAHYPYIFMLEYIRSALNAPELDSRIQSWLKKLPKHSVSCWMTQDHDGHRVGSRVIPEYSDILTTVSMLLPGAVGCYYGQEIAMLNGYITSEQIKDFSGRGSRDGGRLLMQWDGSINAGFSTNTTSIYLPANADFFSRNVESQKNQEYSHYHLFKDLSNLRTTDTIKYGNTTTYAASDYIFVIMRSLGNHVYYVIVNLSSISEKINLNEAVKGFLLKPSVVAASVNANYQRGFELDHEMNIELRMRAMSCIVVEGYHKN